jgi:hypothetical protein
MIRPWTHGDTSGKTRAGFATPAGMGRNHRHAKQRMMPLRQPGFGRQRKCRQSRESSINKMETNVFANQALRFEYPVACGILLSKGDASGGVVELAHWLDGTRVGRIYVRWHPIKDGERPPFLANAHRRELLHLGLDVADGTVLPAHVPKRFDEAAFFQPSTRKNGVDLDAPAVIFRKGRILASVGLVGPSQDVSEILWKGNQNAFAVIRENLMILPQ